MDGKEDKPKEINLDIKMTIEDDGKPEPVSRKGGWRAKALSCTLWLTVICGALGLYLSQEVKQPTEFGKLFIGFLLLVAIVSILAFCVLGISYYSDDKSC